jgi:hypothetical protein
LIASFQQLSILAWQQQAEFLGSGLTYSQRTFPFFINAFLEAYDDVTISR